MIISRERFLRIVKENKKIKVRVRERERKNEIIVTPYEKVRVCERATSSARATCAQGCFENRALIPLAGVTWREEVPSGFFVNLVHSVENESRVGSSLSLDVRC